MTSCHANSMISQAYRQSVSSDHGIDVWLIDPAAVLAEESQPQAILTEEERMNYRQFIFPQGRELYLASHVFLRRVLAQYIGTAPQAVAFSTSITGRPQLRCENGAHRVQFNLSHTFGLIAVVVSRDWNCGIDVEYMRETVDIQTLGSALCTPPERDWLLCMEETAQIDAFFGLWTIKEALLKACGLGVTQDLNNISLIRERHIPHLVVTHSPRIVLPGIWWIESARIASQYCIAIAFGSRDTCGVATKHPARFVTVIDMRRDAKTKVSQRMTLPVLDAAAWQIACHDTFALGMSI